MTLKSMAVAILVVGSPLLLEGCATPKAVEYVPIAEDAPYGYKDRLNPDGGYTLLVAAPAASSISDARAIWDRRAQEICLGEVAKRILFRSERKEFMSSGAYVYQGVGMSQRVPLSYELEGYVYCKAGAPR